MQKKASFIGWRESQVDLDNNNFISFEKVQMVVQRKQIVLMSLDFFFLDITQRQKLQQGHSKKKNQMNSMNIGSRFRKTEKIKQINSN